MTAVAGNTLGDLARECAREIGPFTPFTSSQDSVAANTVIAASLADSEAEPEKYGGWYLYQNAGGTLAGQQQRVKKDGFDGATGSLTTAANYTGNPQNLTPWSLLGVMPWTDQDGLTGLRTCINRMARKLWVRYRYPFTGVSGQTVYDLGAAWWMSRKRVVRLLDPDPGGTGHPPVAGQGWDVVQSGEAWELQLGAGYKTGDVFWLLVEMPLNARLYLSGAWAMQSSPTAGLVLDTDACLGQWNDVFQCSLYEVYAALAIQAGGARKAYWAEKRVEQANVVAQIKLFAMDEGDATLGEGPTDAPGSWSDVVGDKGWWSMW